jgi:uncharacterized protein (DUF4415 family)
MPKKLIVDVTARTEEVVEMTDDEVAEMEAAAAETKKQLDAEQAEADAKAAAKASGDAKLKELGLTDEEIAAR